MKICSSHVELPLNSVDKFKENTRSILIKCKDNFYNIYKLYTNTLIEENKRFYKYGNKINLRLHKTNNILHPLNG